MKRNSLQCAAVLAVWSATLPLAMAQAPANNQSSTPPVSYASVSQLNTLISQVEQAAQATTADLGRLRVEKWKTDSSTKRQVQSDIESLQRNLQSALPEIIGQLRASPEDLTASFKLYRNLDALYDVMVPVVESAGAFGSKDDYQSLANDLDAFERSRRSLGERLDNLTVAKEAELSRLRTQIKAQAAIPPAPPKKIVVDDSEPPKKATKKKVTPKASTSSQPPQSQPQSQSQPQ